MDLADLVQKHDDDLYRGNGKPGITTRMAVCEERIEDVKGDIDELAKNQVWAIRFAVATLIGIVVDVLMNLLKK